MIFSILLATILIALISLVGVVFIYKNHQRPKNLLYLVSLSAGTFLGGAFLHLLPEAAGKLNINLMFTLVLVSFVFYFLLEKIIHWRHCHSDACSVHSFGYVNLIGDSLHNFIDGLIIASAFFIDYKIGIVTTFAIALHEVPQEVGDFGVLLHAGFKKKKALLINFLVALMTTAGGVFGYFLIQSIENFLVYLLPIASGGFLYIAMSDLIPEIRSERNIKKSLIIFTFFLLGIMIMWLTKFLEIE